MIQLQFLNKILNEKDSSLITLNNLTKEYFSDYKNEFEYIKNHIYSYGNVPDKETFLSIFPDFPLMDVKESEKYLMDALCEDRNKRLLAQTFNQIREALNKNDIDKAMSIYKNSSENLIKAKHLECVDIFKDTNRYDKYIEKSTNFHKFYINTGFSELDEIIGGWDREEELAVIMARPGVGKSFCLLKVAIAAAEQGLNVGIYSGEMTADKVGYRLDTLISHISNTKMIHGNIGIQVEYKKFLESIQKNLKGSIKIITPAMINGPAGVTALRAFIEKENLDMLCVDQHSLLEDDRGAKNPIERASNISKDLKNLQVMSKIPIIAVSQQNRNKNEDDGVDLTNIAQTDRIGQDATLVLSLKKKENVLTMDIIKARDGGDGRYLKYYVDLDKGIFTYIPEDKDASKTNKCEEIKEEYDFSDNEESGVF